MEGDRQWREQAGGTRTCRGGSGCPQLCLSACAATMTLCPGVWLSLTQCPGTGRAAEDGAPPGDKGGCCLQGMSRTSSRWAVVPPTRSGAGCAQQGTPARAVPAQPSPGQGCPSRAPPRPHLSLPGRPCRSPVPPRAGSGLGDAGSAAPGPLVHSTVLKAEGKPLCSVRRGSWTGKAGCEIHGRKRFLLGSQPPPQAQAGRAPQASPLCPISAFPGQSRTPGDSRTPPPSQPQPRTCGVQQSLLCRRERSWSRCCSCNRCRNQGAGGAGDAQGGVGGDGAADEGAGAAEGDAGGAGASHGGARPSPRAHLLLLQRRAPAKSGAIGGALQHQLPLAQCLPALYSPPGAAPSPISLGRAGQGAASRGGAGMV